MAFFPDMSLYSYHQSGARPRTHNVGWIEANECFPTGTVSDKFLKRLWMFCKIPVVQTRGFHVCGLCNMATDVVPLLEFEGETLEFGTAEIRVIGMNGLMYASPNLIFHYVRDHGYKPPQVFVDAVIGEPGPETAEYRKHLRAIGLLKS
jgi:hypothetical protein